MSDRIHRPGLVPAAVATLIALAVLVGAIALLLVRCAPRPVPHPSAPPAQASAVATSSAAATATQSVRVTIRRAGSGKVTTSKPSSDATSRTHRDGQVTTPDDQDEEIIIELSQAVTASAASGAIASASVDHLADVGKMIPDHGRLGVALTTMPGVLAADVQLARVDVPPWLVGAPLEVGLDLVGNLEAGGVGVSVGGKAFALVGAWSTWDGRERGIAVGAGLRF